jgi:hypothetical protein
LEGETRVPLTRILLICKRKGLTMISHV